VISFIILKKSKHKIRNLKTVSKVEVRKDLSGPVSASDELFSPSYSLTDNGVNSGNFTAESLQDTHNRTVAKTKPDSKGIPKIIKYFSEIPLFTPL